MHARGNAGGGADGGDAGEPSSPSTDAGGVEGGTRARAPPDSLPQVRRSSSACLDHDARVAALQVELREVGERRAARAAASRSASSYSPRDAARLGTGRLA